MTNWPLLATPGAPRRLRAHPWRPTPRRLRLDGRLEDWLLTLALQCFEHIKSTYRSPKVYEAKRDDLLERIRRMDLAARAEDPEDALDEDAEGNPVWRAPQFLPSIDGDPESSTEFIEQLGRERSRRLVGIRRAKTQAWQEETEWL